MDLDAAARGRRTITEDCMAMATSHQVAKRTASPEEIAGNLDSIQSRPDEQGSAQSAGRAVSAAGEIQRRAHLVAAARRRRTRRPDLGRRLRPDGRHQRLRHVARREVRNLLRAAYPRRDARRAAHDGLGAAAGALARPASSTKRIKTLEAKLGRSPNENELAEHMEHLASPNSKR